MTKSPTKVPRLRSDEAAEAFLANDLSRLDYSAFKRVTFEVQPKSERVNMRLPKPLLDAVKARAGTEGIPYQRYIRKALENSLALGGSRVRGRKAG